MAEDTGNSKAPEIDYDKLGAAVAKSLGASIGDPLKQLADNQKVLADTLAAQAAPAAGGKKADDAAAAAGAGKALTADEIRTIVADGLKTFQQQQTQAAGRQQFIGQHLGKLPEVYQNQLGSDPAKWADEAKQIQQRFEKDLADRGVKLESVGGATRDGGTPAAAAKPDLKELPAFERLAKGLEALPVPGQPVASDTAAPAGAAK